MANKEEFYSGLEAKLKEYHKFPSTYMFKFIVPNNTERLDEVKALFGEKAVLSTKNSKNGKYISVTANEIILESQEVIKVYQKAESIEGLISL